MLVAHGGEGQEPLPARRRSIVMNPVDAILVALGLTAIAGLVALVAGFGY
jgi:hypothetical protein